MLYEVITLLSEKIGKLHQIFGHIVWHSEIHKFLQLTKSVFGANPETFVFG